MVVETKPRKKIKKKKKNIDTHPRGFNFNPKPAGTWFERANILGLVPAPVLIYHRSSSSLTLSSRVCRLRWLQSHNQRKNEDNHRDRTKLEPGRRTLFSSLGKQVAFAEGRRNRQRIQLSPAAAKIDIIIAPSFGWSPFCSRPLCLCIVAGARELSL